MSAYASPGAFRTALGAKLKALAESSPRTVTQLRRQMAYDRLLERLYALDDCWVVKAVALLVRDIGVRGSLDVDVYRAKAADAAEADLRRRSPSTWATGFASMLGPTRRSATTQRRCGSRLTRTSASSAGSAFPSTWLGQICGWSASRMMCRRSQG